MRQDGEPPLIVREHGMPECWRVLPKMKSPSPGLVHLGVHHMGGLVNRGQLIPTPRVCASRFGWDPGFAFLRTPQAPWLLVMEGHIGAPVPSAMLLYLAPLTAGCEGSAECELTGRIRARKAVRGPRDHVTKRPRC